MDIGKIYDEPSAVENGSGRVTITGPDGVAVAMTPGAASETGNRLLDHAAQALGEAMLEEDRVARGLGSRSS